MYSKLEVSNPSLTLDGSSIKGGINYTQTVNSETDLLVGQAVAARINFSVSANIGINTGSKIKYYTKQTVDSDYRLIGTFFVDSISKRAETYTISAYDVISKFDIDCSDWIASCTATTPLALLRQLCTHINVECYNSSFINSSMPIDPKDLYTYNLTGRTILQYIAGVGAGFIKSTVDGKVRLAYFGEESNSVNLTEANYHNITIADANAQAPTINAVRVQVADGYCVRPLNSAGNNELQILYNPLFYKKKAADIAQYVTNIYNKVSTYGKYYPAEINVYTDYKINAGDIIYVNNRKVIVMTKSMSESGCVLSSSGNTQRSSKIQTNTDKISALESSVSQSTYLPDNDNLSMPDPTNIYFRNGWNYDGRTFYTLGSWMTYIQTKVNPSTTYYNVSGSVNPIGAGIVQGTGSYQAGSNATLTAMPTGTYEFRRWLSNGVEVSWNNPVTIAVNSDINYTADFGNKYRVSLELPEGLQHTHWKLNGENVESIIINDNSELELSIDDEGYGELQSWFYVSYEPSQCTVIEGPLSYGIIRVTIKNVVSDCVITLEDD